MKIAVLFGTIWCLHAASAELHSFKTFYTGSTGINGLPQFISLNYLDNELMAYFDSERNRYEAKQSWITEKLGKEYEETQVNIKTGHVQTFAANIQIAMQRFNQTTGVHTYQYMYGCQWDDETQAIDGFNLDAYDGEDLTSLDLKNQRYIAIAPQGQISVNRWNSGGGQLAGQTHYLKEICIEWLKKYIQYGSSALGRKVAPEVSLVQKGPEVACHATGFYPDAVMITWKKDGVEMDDDVDVGETLPNEDGTFQKRAVLTISPEENKAQYSCEITHKSRAEPIVMVFEESGEGNNLPVIIGCVVAVAVLVGVIVAVVMMKKRGYTRASQSDTSSDNSAEPTKA